MTPDRVLITGGAGFLGINLVRFLLARGHPVTSLDLVAFEYPDVRGQIREIQGDIRDPGAVRRAMEGVGGVVHAAAALPLYTPHDIRTTDIDGTRNVLEAARAAGVPRVVHVSSTAVYGIPDHHPLREDDRLHGVGPYGAKGSGEGALNPMGSAVATAVARATGRWPTRLPLTPERVWRLMNDLPAQDD